MRQLTLPHANSESRDCDQVAPNLTPNAVRLTESHANLGQ